MGKGVSEYHIEVKCFLFSVSGILPDDPGYSILGPKKRQRRKNMRQVRKIGVIGGKIKTSGV